MASQNLSKRVEDLKRALKCFVDGQVSVLTWVFLYISTHMKRHWMQTECEDYRTWAIILTIRNDKKGHTGALCRDNDTDIKIVIQIRKQTSQGFCMNQLARIIRANLQLTMFFHFLNAVSLQHTNFSFKCHFVCGCCIISGCRTWPEGSSVGAFAHWGAPFYSS